jgi:hypothetical protein
VVGVGLVNPPQEDLAIFGYKSERKVELFLETSLSTFDEMFEPLVQIW